MARDVFSSNQHLFVSKLLQVPIDLLPTRSVARDKGRRRDGGDKSSAVKLGAAFADKITGEKNPKHLVLKSQLF